MNRQLIILTTSLVFLSGCISSVTPSNSSSVISSTSGSEMLEDITQAVFNHNALTWTTEPNLDYVISLIGQNNLSNDLSNQASYTYINRNSDLTRVTLLFNQIAEFNMLKTGIYTMGIKPQSSTDPNDKKESLKGLDREFKFIGNLNEETIILNKLVDQYTLTIPAPIGTTALDYEVRLSHRNELISPITQQTGNNSFFLPFNLLNKGLNTIQINPSPVDSFSTISYLSNQFSFIHDWTIEFSPESNQILWSIESSFDLSFDLLVDDKVVREKIQSPFNLESLTPLVNKSFRLKIQVYFNDADKGNSSKMLPRNKFSSELSLNRHLNSFEMNLSLSDGYLTWFEDERVDYQVEFSSDETLTTWQPFAPQPSIEKIQQIRKIPLSFFPVGINFIRIVPISNGNSPYITATTYSVNFFNKINLRFNEGILYWESLPFVNYKLSLILNDTERYLLQEAENIGEFSLADLDSNTKSIINQLQNNETVKVQLELKYLNSNFVILNPISELQLVNLVNPSLTNGISYNAENNRIEWTKGSFHTGYRVDILQSEQILLSSNASFSGFTAYYDLNSLPFGEYRFNIRALGSSENVLNDPPTEFIMIVNAAIFFNDGLLTWPMLENYQYTLINLTTNNSIENLTENQYNPANNLTFFSGNNQLQIRYQPKEPLPGTLLRNITRTFSLQRFNDIETLTYNQTTNRVEWTGVNGATGYQVTITNDRGELVYDDVVGNTYLQLNETEAQLLTIQVTPTTTNPNVIDAFPRRIDVLVGFEPKLNNQTLSWDALIGVNYRISYGSGLPLIISSGTSYALNVNDFNVGDNTVIFEVMKDGLVIPYGQPPAITFRKLGSITGVQYVAGRFTWQSVSEAQKYAIYVNQTYVGDVTTNEYTLPSSYEGLVTLGVVAKDQTGDLMQSSETTVNIIDRVTLNYDDGIVSWDPIGNLSYELYIGNTRVAELGRETQFDLTLLNLNPGQINVRVLFFSDNGSISLIYSSSKIIELIKLAPIEKNQVVFDSMIEGKFTIVGTTPSQNIGLSINGELVTIIANNFTFEFEPSISGEVVFSLRNLSANDVQAFIPSQTTTLNIVIGFDLTFEDTSLRWQNMGQGFTYVITLIGQSPLETMTFESQTNRFDFLDHQQNISSGLYDVKVEARKPNKTYDLAQSAPLENGLRMLEPIHDISFDQSILRWRGNLANADQGYRLRLYRGINKVPFGSDIFYQPSNIGQDNFFRHEFFLGIAEIYFIELTPLTASDFFFIKGSNQHWLADRFILSYQNSPSLTIPNIPGLTYVLNIKDLQTDASLPSIALTSPNYDLSTISNLIGGKTYQFSVTINAIQGSNVFLGTNNKLEITKLNPIQNLIFKNDRYLWSAPVPIAQESNVINRYDLKFNDSPTFNETNNEVLWSRLSPYFSVENKVANLSVRVARSGLFIPSDAVTSVSSLAILPSPSLLIYATPGFDSVYSPTVNPRLRIKLDTTYAIENQVSTSLTITPFKGLNPKSPITREINFESTNWVDVGVETDDSRLIVKAISKANVKSNELINSIESVCEYTISTNALICNNQPVYNHLKRLKNISLANNHIIAISNHGDVWTMGPNENRILGIADGVFTDSLPIYNISGTLTSLMADQEISMAEAGYNHAGLVTNNGKLLLWGRRDYGAIGDGWWTLLTSGQGEWQKIPKEIKIRMNPQTSADFISLNHQSSLNVSSLAIGQQNTYALMNQVIYPTGIQQKNKLGLPNQNVHYQSEYFSGINQTTDRLYFTNTFNINSINNQAVQFIQVRSGLHFAAAITNTGRVVVWGENNHLQAGNSSATSGSNSFVAPVYLGGFPLDTVVKNISLGFTHGLALTETNQVYSWGDYDFGALGLEGTIKVDSHLARPVSIPGSVLQIAAGDRFSLALNDAGELWSWGHNNLGQLGLGSTNTSVNDVPRKVVMPTLLEGEEIVAITAGNDHAAFLTNYGRLFTWGSFANNRLGYRPGVNILVPTLVPQDNFGRGILVYEKPSQ